jgi:hypothetical protein
MKMLTISFQLNHSSIKFAFNLSMNKPAIDFIKCLK